MTARIQPDRWHQYPGHHSLFGSYLAAAACTMVHAPREDRVILLDMSNKILSL